VLATQRVKVDFERNCGAPLLPTLEKFEGFVGMDLEAVCGGSGAERIDATQQMDGHVPQRRHHLGAFPERTRE